MREQKLLKKETLTPEEAAELVALAKPWTTKGGHCHKLGAIRMRKADHIAKHRGSQEGYYHDDDEVVWADKNICRHCIHRLRQCLDNSENHFCTGVSFTVREEVKKP